MSAQSAAKDAWVRCLLDILRHGYDHYLEDGETARRHALVGFDQSIEVAIQGFAEHVIRDPVASTKKFRNFEPKIDFLKGYVLERGIQTSWSFEGVEYHHSLRNRVYHWPSWWAPEPADVEAARRDAVALAGFVSDADLASTFAARPDAVRLTAGAPPEGKRKLTRDEARELVAAAHEVARRLSPRRDAAGIHVLEIAGELRRHGRFVPDQGLFDLLKNHQERFDHIGRSMFRWRKDVRPEAGVSGRELAALAHDWCRRHDPAHLGKHYDREIKPGLENEGVKIYGGVSTGGTVYGALYARRDLFERERGGVYRWIAQDSEAT